MRKTKPKIGLFFGAGAEISYGLPSGGRFALDIFRMDPAEDKERFKELRSQVNRRSHYAAKWLPEKYESLPVSTFGKSQYESLLKSSLENKRANIIEFLNNFDEQAPCAKSPFEEAGLDIDEAFRTLTGKLPGEEVFSHEVKLNEAFGSEIRLFSSHYFSALLQVLEAKCREPSDWIGDIRQAIRAFMELLIGAVGEDLLHRLNDTIFEKKPDSIDLFDEFCGFFKLDYSRLGLSGLDYVLGSRHRQIRAEMEPGHAVAEFARRLLEEIFVVALDYRSLIDSYYRYLFSPKTHWAKFCRIAIFLMTVRRYITQHSDETRKKIAEKDGYYQDLDKLASDCEIAAIGTTNYNTFLQDVSDYEVVHLNGSVEDYYDPYRNKIVSEEEMNSSGHICVPFLFTQSGIKPLTSVSMSRRYVSLFDKFTGCNLLAAVGFSFNMDDGHINGMFRALIEDENKKVVILHRADGSKARYEDKLRLSGATNLIIEPVDNNRQCHGRDWFKSITEYL